MFNLIIICVTLLLMTTDVTQSTLTQLPVGITVHKGIVTWDEALAGCQREGNIKHAQHLNIIEGAVIASPINGKALDAMRSVIGAYNITYFIGTKATHLPGQFVSIEGVTLDSMPLAVKLNMIQQLDQWEGDCLAMSQDSIRAVPCWSRLPYMCYNTDIFNVNRTNCGPDEEGYKYDTSTGHCYKLYKDPAIWDQAHWTCAAEGSYLVILEDEKEAHIIKNMDDYTHNHYIFIGLRKQSGKEDWKSIHGEPVEKLYNDWQGIGSRSDKGFECGGLHQSGKWQNVNCGSALHFICEKEPSV